MAKREPNTPPDLARAIAAQDWPEALCLAARFRHLGPGRDAIMSAWTCIRHERFYREELRKDPEAVVAAGIAALLVRFG